MKRKLQITGKGKLAISPDIIILSFDAASHEWEYEKTVTALNEKVEQLRSLLDQAGIERTNLKTKDFGIRKDTKRNQKTDAYDFNGYSASHNLELELPLEKKLINTLLNQIAKQLDNLNFSIAFGVKDASKHQQQLILQAIAKAKENALLIAGATGVELKEIIDIDYSYRELTIRSHRYDYPMYESDMATTCDAAPDFEPDDIDVAETVNITWRIE